MAGEVQRLVLHLYTDTTLIRLETPLFPQLSFVDGVNGVRKELKTQNV